MHQENKQWLPSAWLVFGNHICWYATTVLSQICPIILATCWNLLSKYGEFRNFFPHNLAIWGHWGGKKKRVVLCIIRTSTSFLLPRLRKFAQKNTFFCCQDAKIRRKKHKLAAQGACLVSETHIRWFASSITVSKLCSDIYGTPIPVVALPRSLNHHPIIIIKQAARIYFYSSKFQDCFTHVQILETKSAGHH